MESLSKSRRSVVASLGKKKMRLKHTLFAIEGDKSVSDILFAYPNKFEVNTVIALSEWIDTNYNELIRIGLDQTKIVEATTEDLVKMSSLSTPPEVIAVCRLPEAESITGQVTPDLYLMLDGIQDPGNMGTIVRTAHWFGIKKIFASHTTVDLYNPKCIQASMGSMAAVNVIYTDLKDVIQSNPSIPAFGLLLEGENIYSAPLPSSGFIIMGNEGSGLSPEIRQLISKPLTIPPYNPSEHAESLNVAMATGITLAMFRKQQLK